MSSVYSMKTGYARHDPRLIRLRNPQTGAYLHMSGKGETAGKAHAWLGLKRQAKMIRERAKIRGEAFPYKVEEP